MRYSTSRSVGVALHGDPRSNLSIGALVEISRSQGETHRRGRHQGAACRSRGTAVWPSWAGGRLATAGRCRSGVFEFLCRPVSFWRQGSPAPGDLRSQVAIAGGQSRCFAVRGPAARPSCRSTRAARGHSAANEPGARSGGASQLCRLSSRPPRSAWPRPAEGRSRRAGAAHRPYRGASSRRVGASATGVVRDPHGGRKHPLLARPGRSGRSTPQDWAIGRQRRGDAWRSPRRRRQDLVLASLARDMGGVRSDR